MNSINLEAKSNAASISVRRGASTTICGTIVSGLLKVKLTTGSIGLGSAPIELHSQQGAEPKARSMCSTGLQQQLPISQCGWLKAIGPASRSSPTAAESDILPIFPIIIMN